jgi:ABC-type transport system involved in multi-copper enzyme maturation permease subunit
LLGPIFNRELLTVPRRDRHYIARAAFLGALWVIALTAWLRTLGPSRSATLGETARFGPLLFQVLTLVELALFLFFAALSAASAISQEKDRRTFILLLMTDLRNHEIVLGKLLGSLLPIAALLAGSVPLLMMLLLLGGIALHQVLQAVLIVAATALAAGSLGGLVALWRERTFQSLALTVLFLVLYLCVVRATSVLPNLFSAVTDADVHSLQQRFDPFLALQSVQEPVPNAAVAGLAPAYVYALAMFGIAVLLNVWGLVKLRVWNPSGEPIMQREKPADETEVEDSKARVAAHAAPGKSRRVGPNPILWREIYTRAYGRRPLMVKAAYFVVLAFIGYYALAPIVFPHAGERLPAFAAAYGMVPVAVLSLLLVAAQAATAITSERDTGALDLLLVTDLTPREFIFGKLGGIVYNTKEYLIPPLILAIIYAWYELLASPPQAHPEFAGAMNASSLLCVLGGSLVLLTFATVLGVHVALRTQNSRLAIINTLSTVFFLSVGTGVCIALILINGRFEYQWGSFVFFVVAGVGGLWYVLSGDRPSTALSIASWLCPFAVFYTVANLLVAKPGSTESADPLLPFLVIAGAFGFATAAMLVPLLSEFDVALGRTSGGAD